ncbi:MAG: hypothetical protein WD136_03455, partial [Cyanobium sp.]
MPPAPTPASRSANPTTQARQSAGFRAMPTGEVAMRQGLSSERQELLCSLIGLALKVGLVIVAGVSLARLASAYQERMERQGELAAVLDLERAKLAKA